MSATVGPACACRWHWLAAAVRWMMNKMGRATGAGAVAAASAKEWVARRHAFQRQMHGGASGGDGSSGNRRAAWGTMAQCLTRNEPHLDAAACMALSARREVPCVFAIIQTAVVSPEISTPICDIKVLDVFLLHLVFNDRRRLTIADTEVVTGTQPSHCGLV